MSPARSCSLAAAVGLALLAGCGAVAAVELGPFELSGSDFARLVAGKVVRGES